MWVEMRAFYPHLHRTLSGLSSLAVRSDRVRNPRAVVGVPDLTDPHVISCGREAGAQPER